MQSEWRYSQFKYKHEKKTDAILGSENEFNSWHKITCINMYSAWVYHLINTIGYLIIDFYDHQSQNNAHFSLDFLLMFKLF